MGEQHGQGSREDAIEAWVREFDTAMQCLPTLSDLDEVVEWNPGEGREDVGICLDRGLLLAARSEAIDLMKRMPPPKCYAVIGGDGECVGIYSTLTLAAQAMARIPCCCVEERELDKLPDEPEPRGEPDYNAPSSQERAERDSFDADRGGKR